MATIDQSMVKMKYAVRGAVVEKAEEMKSRLLAGEELPFKELVMCNIGNPHAVRQKPITFYRQVAACCLCPSLLELEGAQQPMPADVIERAQQYLAGMGGSGVGSYTHSNGLPVVRQQIAAFIERRDGFPCDPDMVSLTTGASEGVKRCIQALIGDDSHGVMIPCPQYPLYSAALTMCGGKIVYYALDEDRVWSVTRVELDRAFDDAAGDGTRVRAIAVINPGNPSGAVLAREDVAMIITWARDRRVVILADEVYQENIYVEGKRFHSFKKVLRELEQGDSTFSSVQLVSFHSTSKGLLGECGQRGGYAEFVGFSNQTMALFTKVAATSLSSNTIGQVFCGLMVTPPAEGSPSYTLFREESQGIFDGLQRRSKVLQEGLNAIEGITCQEIEGAMYGFPRLAIPTKAEEAAATQDMPADEYWCLRLVEETGVVVVPGSGFGQRDGTYHFRITILPPDGLLEDTLVRIKAFQEKFLKEFA